MEAVIRPQALVFDDTGFLKDGTASACVSRQYTGTAGKVTDCQVGVSLHLASDHASASASLLVIARSLRWTRLCRPALKWRHARLGPGPPASGAFLGPGWGRKDGETP
jgi:hypothetical protein